RGERPRDPSVPQIEGTGEIRLESADRATGYWTTNANPGLPQTRTAGVYLRADPDDLTTLDGRDDRQRAKLIAERLKRWKSVSSM
ncbi:MAG TPA: hypothetical protein VFN91_09925, partial [Myxococcaceae bacterium]|nr:hypothetical protein [Myxococcaceae bacterium]